MLEDSRLLQHGLQAGHQVFRRGLIKESVAGFSCKLATDFYFDVTFEELVHLPEKMTVRFLDSLDDLPDIAGLLQLPAQGLELDELSAQLSDEVVVTPDHFSLRPVFPGSAVPY